MNSIVVKFAVCVLFRAGVRQAMLIREALQEYRESRNVKALIPRDGSLEGIDTNGNLKTPNIDANGHLDGKGHLLAFVIHRQRITHDLQYWNHVIELLGGLRPGRPGAIQYWGVCDDGRSCDSYQSAAHFSILGYLDPYEMHIMAKADTRHEAILYDRFMILRARIAIATDPSAESNLIHQKF